MLQFYMISYNYKLKDTSLEDSIDFKKFKNVENILIQVFCGEGKNRLENLIEELLLKLPQSILIGTTTDGEIVEKDITTFNSIVSISIFTKTTLISAYEEGTNSFENGYNLAKKISTPSTKLLILFTDGTNTNGENFLKGVETFNSTIPICGVWLEIMENLNKHISPAKIKF